jgi:hypothetical protein
MSSSSAAASIGGGLITGVLIVAVILLLFAYVRTMVGHAKSSSGFSTRHVELLSICPRCGCGNPQGICKGCLSCSQCRRQNRCNACQMFGRQIGLIERTEPCCLCGRRPCVCAGPKGNPVLREPGVARNGIFNDPAARTFDG